MLKVKRNDHATADAPLILDAEDLVLNKLTVDGSDLSARSFGFSPRLMNLPHAPLRHASVCSTHYSWAHEDVLELKGPLPSEFTLSADVTVKPEVPHLAPRVASLPPPAPLFGSSGPVPLVPP